MSKLIVTAFLLVTNSLVVKTSAYRFATHNPYSLAIGSTVYTVCKYSSSIQIDQYIAVGQQSSSTCNITVDPITDQIQGRITAAVMWHKIIVWGERSQEHIDNGKIRQTNYTVLLIDPKRCTYKAIPDLVDEVSTVVQHVPPAVLVHSDSFDFFFPSLQKCSPCSYDINGEENEALDQLKHKVKPGGPFDIQELGDSKNYAYLYNFDNGTAVIRLLNRRFKDLESVRTVIYATVEKLSVSSDKEYVGVDYIFPEKPRQDNFVMFNSKVDISYLVHLPLIDNYNPIQTLVSINSRGNAYVAVVQKSQLDKSKKITLVHYDAKGHLIDERDLADLMEDTDYDVQGLLVPDSYCLVIHVLRSEHEGFTNIDCIDVP